MSVECARERAAAAIVAAAAGLYGSARRAHTAAGQVGPAADRSAGVAARESQKPGMPGLIE